MHKITSSVILTGFTAWRAGYIEVVSRRGRGKQSAVDDTAAIVLLNVPMCSDCCTAAGASIAGFYLQRKIIHVCLTLI